MYLEIIKILCLNLNQIIIIQNKKTAEAVLKNRIIIVYKKIWIKFYLKK